MGPLTKGTEPLCFRIKYAFADGDDGGMVLNVIAATVIEQGHSAGSGLVETCEKKEKKQQQQEQLDSSYVRNTH